MACLVGLLASPTPNQKITFPCWFYKVKSNFCRKNAVRSAQFVKSLSSTYIISCGLRFSHHKSISLFCECINKFILNLQASKTCQRWYSPHSILRLSFWLPKSSKLYPFGYKSMYKCVNYTRSGITSLKVHSGDLKSTFESYLLLAILWLSSQ